MRNILEFAGLFFSLVFGLLVAVILFVGAIFTISALGTQAYCNTQIARSPNFNIQWGWFTGCQVETVDGLWVDYSTFATNENGLTIKLKTK